MAAAGLAALTDQVMLAHASIAEHAMGHSLDAEPHVVPRFSGAQRAMTTAATSQRVNELADIHRAASLQDLFVDARVAPARSRMNARFCVELRRTDHYHWAFSVNISDVKRFHAELIQRVKVHHKQLKKQSAHGAGSRRHHERCPTCAQLRQELKHWPRFSPLSGIGKRRLGEKCDTLEHFLQRLFLLLSSNAQWLQSCELLREILRMTEAFCRLEYANDGAIVRAIQAFQRVPAPSTRHAATTTRMTFSGTLSSGAGKDCYICLDDLHDPKDDAIDGPVAARTALAVELPCGHRFHDSCICMWFYSRLNCPVCRSHPSAAVPV